jgi:glycosyltransferase involved in cell wall biosynthesis
MGTPTVDILLATYNGSNYLDDQLNSIVSQSFTNWNLLVRDDGSSDNSTNIVQRYQMSHRNKIHIIQTGDKSLGACQNFDRLLEYSSADYVMFCDQDDVWLANKIELTFNEIQRLEKIYSKNTPILVHTNLIVTDANLSVISDSFWKYQNLNPELGSTFSRLLMQNVVTGNTIMINHSAKESAIPIPKEAIMHDWWFALVVAAFGKLKHIEHSTIYYRQHAHNETGAKKWGLDYILTKATEGFGSIKLKESIFLCERQAKAFLARYASKLSSNHYATVYAISQLSEYNPLVKRWAIWRYQLLKMGFTRNLALFLRI